MAVLKRIFSAVGLPPEHREAVAHWIEANDVPGRTPPPENLHVTIRWFGDLEDVVFDRLLGALDGSELLPPPFAIHLGGPGAFPRAAKATVGWIATEAPELGELREAVDEAARDAGIDDEDRPFRPHLTVSRIQPEMDLRRWIEATPPLAISVPVDRVVFLRSHLGDGPAEYELLEDIGLGR